MRTKLKLKISIITLGIIFALSTNSNFTIIDYQRNIAGTIENRDETKLKSSGYWNLPFIHIDGSSPGNWTDTLAEPWCRYVNGFYVIENVTIDASTSPTGSGILINNSKNEYFIIRNCTVSNAGSGTYDAGIKLENTNNGTLISNNCSNNGFNGILLYDHSDNNSLTGNTASNIGTSNQVYGIFLYNECNNNTISGNIANDNSVGGIHLHNCDNNIISGNTVSNIGTWAQNYGIFIRNDSDNNTISGNTANNHYDNGIYLYIECDNNTIAGNTANDNRCGIYLENDCEDNTISGNAGNDNSYCGIFLYIKCNGNTILGNIGTSNQILGMRISEDSDNNTISGNTVSNNGHNGIYLDGYCDDNTILGNIVNNNGHNGIKILEYCDNNTISRNKLYYNIREGAALATSCVYNLFYLNGFVGNGHHALDYGNNQWDNGIVGNYWDDYSGDDILPMDGIGDTPYSLPVGKSDRKPLMYFGGDLDGDSFCDSDEINFGTDPLDALWYPMPNLKVSHFSSVIAHEKTSFVLDFSISNNGIWKAEGVIVIVWCEELDITLFNNTVSPLTLDVDETEYIAVNYPSFGQTGTFQLNLTIDPDNIIAETYSAKNGSIRVDAENDNSQTADLTILPGINTLNLAIMTQSFSIDDFNISFFIYDDNSQYIDFATIQLWWNGVDISDDVSNYGDGLYFASLDPITVELEGDPILLKMTISAPGYEDKHFEMHIAVDPETLEKGVVHDGDEFPFLILIIALISVVGGIGATIITVGILRKRSLSKEVI